MNSFLHLMFHRGFPAVLGKAVANMREISTSLIFQGC